MIRTGVTVTLIAVTLASFSGLPAAAATTDTFSLQVTPSPLVATVKPGATNTFPLQVRNNGTATESLKTEIRTFTFDDQTGNVSIGTTPATDLAQWVTFSGPQFSVAPGQVYTQNVKVAFPATAGFSYSFAILISRQSQPEPTGNGHLLQGTIAVFGLINIDRPGAIKSLHFASVKTDTKVYEYVPATFKLRFSNTGNVFLQPLGNIFIGRGDVETPIDTLTINETGAYVLPGTIRTLTSTWDDGFPRYQTDTLSDGTTKTHLVWNWADLSKFRVGKYTARVVAVYNNGSFDVPLNARVSFWIIPWKILLGALLVALFIAFGAFMFIRTIVRGLTRGNRRNRLR